MVVQHNITSMNANRNLSVVGNRLAKASEKLASGYRINRAGDDAAGLAISEKLRAEVRGLQRASKNAQDGISAVQTMEGVMDAQHEIAQRARELLVQRANSTLTDTDKIDDELSQLVTEFSKIVSNTSYNKTGLSDIASASVQVGAYSGAKIDLGGQFEQTLSTGSIDAVDDVIENVSANRSTLGAVQNRLEYRVKVLDNAAENVSAAESRIRDTDMADEMTRFSKENILQQAATSMLAQANQANQGVLSLLQ